MCIDVLENRYGLLARYVFLFVKFARLQFVAIYHFDFHCVPKLANFDLKFDCNISVV